MDSSRDADSGPAGTAGAERDTHPVVGPPASSAAGPAAVASTIRHTLGVMGPGAAIRSLAVINQPEGFDCPGCAWPEADPPQRHRVEFCENGAKAVAEEAMSARADEAFFASRRRVAPFPERPLARPAGASGCADAAPGGGDPLHTGRVGRGVRVDRRRARSLDDPNRAVFYTSGRTSNEAAYLYQLFARTYGTNNLPDCSNMCHEASGEALGASIGIGKGTVRLADFDDADLIVVMGQNPGTNHPRMLATLEAAKAGGARIITINPLREAGLLRFRNPQTPRGLFGHGTSLSDLHLPIALGADHALFQWFNARLVADGAIDERFLDEHTVGFDALRAHLASRDLDSLAAATGLDPTAMNTAYRWIAASKATIVCWAMGLTQHVGAVATIREVANLALLGGHIGRPGAGLCPVRGHSNVQGDRTMGIAERPPTWIDRLDARHGIHSPRRPGLDTARSIEALHRGEVTALVCLGGNFVRAIPDTDRTEAALDRVELSVHVSTKLNRSHLVCGASSLILPTLGRTERDRGRDGERFVTVEDSMGRVHRSAGVLRPAGPRLRSEVSIVASLAAAVLRRRTPPRGATIDWASLGEDYDLVRDHIAAVVPGFEQYNERARTDAGFELPHAARDLRRFDTPSGRAELFVGDAVTPRPPPGGLLLQTLRSHDQFNTTIYGLDDRYRGVRNGRMVVFVNAVDLARLGLYEGQLVDLVSRFDDVERRVEGFRIVCYDTPAGCAAAYFPETNPLIAVSHRSPEAGTPASKAVPVFLEPVRGPAVHS
ncbi:MAG: FdhF/YdeP family oxidoreductase [Microthrixaceae bacterium]